MASQPSGDGPADAQGRDNFAESRLRSGRRFARGTRGAFASQPQRQNGGGSLRASACRSSPPCNIIPRPRLDRMTRATCSRAFAAWSRNSSRSGARRRSTASPPKRMPPQARDEQYERELLMPLRQDLKSILLIGSGPIVIGQSLRVRLFGHASAQRRCARRGLRLILVNSNPATIMTDPELADRTYGDIEPMTVAAIEQIIARERPDALIADGRRPDGNSGLPIELCRNRRARTLWRRAYRLAKARGDIQKGRGPRPLQARDDRYRARSAGVRRRALARAGGGNPRAPRRLPLIIRPSRTLGGTGGSIARDPRGVPRQRSSGAWRCRPITRC